jgi:hypothetical protein
MATNSEAECHPYAMLDRCQSRRVASVPIGDNLQMLMARKTEAPPYEDLINFPRAKDKDEIRCVMCGFPPGMSCAIPRQNKDVCKECDKSTWVHSVSNVYFKWCKGCKKFLRLGCFSEKLDAAKCDRCRERGRQSYLLKKGKDGCLSTTSGNRSRSNSITSMKSSDFESELSDNILSVAAAIANSRKSNGSPSSLSPSPSHHHHQKIHSEISSEEGDYIGRDGVFSEDGEYDHYSSRSRCRSLSPRGIIGDYNDTLMSAHAVVSFSKYQNNENDHPVLIDDTTADVTKSKLSSVFGKPLCELKRMPPSTSTHLVSSSESSDEQTDHGEDVAEEGGGGGTTDSQENKVPQSQSSSSASSGPVCTSLRGTLYELACIHERIMTLEEHASRVKCLEATIKEQRVEIESLRSNTDTLRQQLKESRRQQGLEVDNDDNEVEPVVNQTDNSLKGEEEGEGSSLSHDSDDVKDIELRAQGGLKRSVASDLAMILDDPNALEVLADVMDRVQKRPRVVSMGE